MTFVNQILITINSFQQEIVKLSKKNPSFEFG